MSLVRILLPLLVVGMLIALPVDAQAANASFFGPIIDRDCLCNGPGEIAPDWGCVLDIVHNTLNLLFSLAILVFALAVAYSGFQIMLNPTNPEKRTEARKMLLNIVVGLMIALSAWLIVDFVMRIFYEDSAGWGPWNRILADGDPKRCLLVNKDLPSVVGSVGLGGPDIDITTGEEVGDDVARGDRVTCNKLNAGEFKVGTVTSVSEQEITKEDGTKVKVKTLWITYDEDDSLEKDVPLDRCNKLTDEEALEEDTTYSGCPDCTIVTGVPRKAAGTACNTNTGCNVNGGCDPQTSPRLEKPAPDCMINSALLGELQSVETSISWQITEMWPPTVNHSNACHGNGTCVDIAVRTANPTASQIAAFGKSFTGMRAVFETTSCDLRDAVKRLGVEAHCKEENAYKHITGNHFSIYYR